MNDAAPIENPATSEPADRPLDVAALLQLLRFVAAARQVA